MTAHAFWMRCITALGSCLAGVGWAPPVAGQEPGRQVQDVRGPSFGFSLGGESVPAGLDRECWEAAGRRAMPMFGVFVVVPVGPFGLQGRVSGHHSVRPDFCLAGPLLQPGIRTELAPVLPPGDFVSLDLHLRWALTESEDGGWFVAAGGGWAASSKDVPYVSTIVGARSRMRGIRFGVDLEVAAYRVPWMQRTVETTTGFEMIELSRHGFEEWATTVGARVSIEIPVVPE